MALLGRGLTIDQLYAADLDEESWLKRLVVDRNFREEVEKMREYYVLPIDLEKALHTLREREMYDSS